MVKICVLCLQNDISVTFINKIFFIAPKTKFKVLIAMNQFKTIKSKKDGKRIINLHVKPRFTDKVKAFYEIISYTGLTCTCISL